MRKETIEEHKFPISKQNYIVKINTETLFNQITKEEFRSIFLAKERYESL